MHGLGTYTGMQQVAAVLSQVVGVAPGAGEDFGCAVDELGRVSH
jgi:hypothetical protein